MQCNQGAAYREPYGNGERNWRVLMAFWTYVWLVRPGKGCENTRTELTSKINRP